MRSAPLLERTRREVEREYLLKAERFRRSEPPLLAWSERFRREDGERLDFNLFPFQVEIYQAFGDKSLPTVDVMKSGQCGISAAGVSLALYAGDVWQANVLYLLPTQDDVYDFSDTRIKPAIEDSGYLFHRVASTDNKGLKRIGAANLYFRGSVSPNKALSIPADILILDELDRLTAANVPAFRKRLGSPTSLKLERRFSNPSWPEFGIHQLYLDSDQREWLVRCPACRGERSFAYDEGDGHHHVDEDQAARICGRCHRELSAEAVGHGRWVAARPSVAARGYHISKLIVPRENIGALITEHRKTDEDSVTAHCNFDLGLPYSPKGGALSRELVMACRRDYTCPASYAGEDWVTAGVDVGKVLHVRISRWPAATGKAIPLYLGTVSGFDDLARLWDRYNVNFGLVDERPEERAARAFAEQFSGRCMLVRWSGSGQHDDIVTDEDQRLVIARRSWSCDQTVDVITRQLRLLPRNLPADYISSMTAPHRVLEVTKDGQKVPRYVHERPDDWFFCETHDLLAKATRGAAAAGGWSAPPPSVRETVRRRRR